MLNLRYLSIFLTTILLVTPTFNHSFADELTEEEVSLKNFSLVGIALFGGTDPFSKAIKKVTSSPYSHVGIILCDNDDTNNLYCFESTGTPSEVLSLTMPHVRVTAWDEVVSDYPGSITTRFIKFDEGNEPDCNQINQFVLENNGKSYETGIFELFGSLNDKNTESDLSTLFCSELVAAMLMELGYMKKGPSNNWVPSEFSENCSTPLTLIGAELLDEHSVKEMPPKKFGCCTIM
jgi:hypothetical protein